VLLTHQQTLHRILHALEIIGVKYVFPKLFIITPTKLPDDKYLMIKQVFWSSVFLKNRYRVRVRARLTLTLTL